MKADCRVSRGSCGGRVIERKRNGSGLFSIFSSLVLSHFVFSRVLVPYHNLFVVFVSLLLVSFFVVLLYLLFLYTPSFHSEVLYQCSTNCQVCACHSPQFGDHTLVSLSLAITFLLPGESLELIIARFMGKTMTFHISHIILL